MPPKYLITGATGGLGKQVLHHFIETVPRSEFAATSSKPSNRSMFEDHGIAFRHVNYNDPESLATGLRGIENLLFVSSVGNSRITQHRRLIDAAKEAGVKHVRSKPPYHSKKISNMFRFGTHLSLLVVLKIIQNLPSKQNTSRRKDFSRSM